MKTKQNLRWMVFGFCCFALLGPSSARCSAQEEAVPAPVPAWTNTAGSVLVGTPASISKDNRVTFALPDGGTRAVPLHIFTPETQTQLRRATGDLQPPRGLVEPLRELRRSLARTEELVAVNTISRNQAKERRARAHLAFADALADCVVAGELSQADADIWCQKEIYADSPRP